MAVDRLLPDDDARDLIALVRDIGARTLAPQVEAAEATGTFPREVFGVLGRAGLLGLAAPPGYGGSGLPATVYLQVVEELASVWMSVAVGVSVHSLSCWPLAAFGTVAQRERWLPDLVGGERLGAFMLSELQAGSDVASIATAAEPTGDGYRVTGTKAWITHGGEADFYTLIARTSPDGARGLSCFLVDGASPGLAALPPERKMGLKASRTSQVVLDGVHLEADRLIGRAGQGMSIALAALDRGRLGIAAAATGLAQAALDYAVRYAAEREQFGAPIAQLQGVSFLLAQMAARVDAARATYLEAARRCDAGLPFTRAAAVAKLTASEAAMRVTTDAVQVLGGAGYTTDHPVERWMREAKVTEIFEGTSQIQKLVIGRRLLAELR
ncbi:MAG TPA: acyl-CoA dehydrogenase family protein [Kineosporiaceae bacterium]